MNRTFGLPTQSTRRGGRSASPWFWRHWTLVAALTVLPALTAEAQPKTPVGQVTIGLGGLAGFPAGDDFGTGMGVNAWFAFRVTSFLLLELNASWTTGTVESRPTRFSGGRYRLIPVQAGLRLGRSLGDRTFAYAAGGGAYTVHRITVDESLRATWEGLGFEIREEVDPVLRPYVGLGGLYRFTRHFLLSLDARLVIGGGTVGRWTLRDRTTQTAASGNIPDVSTGGFTLRGGFAYTF